MNGLVSEPFAVPPIQLSVLRRLGVGGFLAAVVLWRVPVSSACAQTEIVMMVVVVEL